MKIVYLLLIVWFLAACSFQEMGEKNPRSADVEIENQVVTIKIPGPRPSFRLEKVNDDSVAYREIFFKYDKDEKNFFIRTNRDEWQSIATDENTIKMGQAQIRIEEEEITITYPSGTWAFP